VTVEPETGRKSDARKRRQRLFVGQSSIVRRVCGKSPYRYLVWFKVEGNYGRRGIIKAWGATRGRQSDSSRDSKKLPCEKLNAAISRVKLHRQTGKFSKPRLSPIAFGNQTISP
jgi:hypothetical protein